MWPIKMLQIHVTHACNLACTSCSHYSNHGHKGMLDLETAARWMAQWGQRLQPRAFVLLGGEPTIHPQLTAFIPLARRHFPNSQIQVVTNGFFLDRHPDLPHALRQAGNTRLDISVHHDSWQYGALIAKGLELAQTWQRTHGIEVYVRESFKSWREQYQGFGADMRPYHDGNPQASWDICPAKHCFQLLDGNVYKCAPLAYLPMQAAKYPLSPEWDPYLAYEPLAAGCSDEALQTFFQMEAESVCNMCAAYPRQIDKPWPLAAPQTRRQSTTDPT